MSLNAKRFDVVVIGAGLAGLTLARQLQLRKPDLSIALIEHRCFPAPEAAHKVGESTVEIAAHYLEVVLGLKPHLTDAQLPKFGLRLFFRGAQRIEGDLAKYDELGASRILPIPTYQIDRGRLENHLAQLCRAAGATILDGTTVRKVDVRPGAHTVVVRNDDVERVLVGRNLVDASGRRAWLRNQHNLGRNVRHKNHAAWFRIEGSIDPDAWSGDTAWQARCHATPRRLSTNHFTGPGYWLWLIPLPSNATSVGLVYDPSFVDPAHVSRHAKLLDWIAREHPVVAHALADRPAIDFHKLKNYTTGTSQMFSSEGWMATGDSGAFTDPFYSPGADFIAIANTYITEIITRDLKGADRQVYQAHFLGFFASTLSLYKGQYGGFGSRDLMIAKTIWDFSYYWAVLSRLFFSGRFTDIDFMTTAQQDLAKAASLNSGVQRMFRAHAKNADRNGGDGRFFDYHALPYFHRIKEDLLTANPEHAGLDLEHAATHMHEIAGRLTELLSNSARPFPSLDELGQEGLFA